MLITVWYLGDKAAYLFRQTVPELGAIQRIAACILYLKRAFIPAFPSFYPSDILFGLLADGIAVLALSVKRNERRNLRSGTEFGSAKWGRHADILPFMDKDPWNNIPLTQTESIMLSGRPKDPRYARNKNILVIGGSGSGKTRFFVKPSIMQMHSSYVITDPKGTLITECGKMLARGVPKPAFQSGKDGVPLTDKKGNLIRKTDAKGRPDYVRDKDGRIVYEPYEIRSFNTINFDKSSHYNPFHYIRSEVDILKLVTALIENTKGEGSKSGEDFWIQAEKLLYEAYIGYLYYEAPE